MKRKNDLFGVGCSNRDTCEEEDDDEFLHDSSDEVERSWRRLTCPVYVCKGYHAGLRDRDQTRCAPYWRWCSCVLSSFNIDDDV